MGNSLGPDADFYKRVHDVSEMMYYGGNILDMIYEEIEHDAIIGAIYKLRNIIPTNIPQHIDYVEPEKIIQYDETLHNEIAKYNKQEFSNIINSFFLNKDEEISKESIDKIIELIVEYKCIELWEHFYTTHTYSEPNIKTYYESFVNQIETIYNKLLEETNSNDKPKHECIDYKFMKLKPLENHNCIVCGKKYCEIIQG